MPEIRMPSLGADMEAGTLVEWLMKPGDRVRSGDIIAVVETQKGAIEVEVFQEGVVSNILVPEGEQARSFELLLSLDRELPMQTLDHRRFESDVVERSLQRVELRPQRLFFLALAIVPGAALQRHHQDVIADEMRVLIRPQPAAIGFMRAERVKLFGAG